MKLLSYHLTLKTRLFLETLYTTYLLMNAQTFWLLLYSTLK